MECSLTSSITLLQLIRWLVSRKWRKKWVDLVHSELIMTFGDRNVTNVPAGKRLYLKTSQRTSLFGSRVNGSLNMQTGMRYMSLLEPSAWYVLEPSKFHSGMSDKMNSPKEMICDSLWSMKPVVLAILALMSETNKYRRTDGRNDNVQVHFLNSKSVTQTIWILHCSALNSNKYLFFS